MSITEPLHFRVGDWGLVEFVHGASRRVVGLCVAVDYLNREFASDQEARRFDGGDARCRSKWGTKAALRGRLLFS